MIRRPPTSTLFPSAPPFRSRHPVDERAHRLDVWRCEPVEHRDVGHGGDASRLSRWRSEEHTSELQSRQYLVCRLLLEKKKQLGTLLPACRASVSTVLAADGG